ncbi:hypothetical protein F4810DRAFT_717053 [Camillea tinctor]|nr:hypothetical protein F4810DRAFT_717053 [Camillea tinctor]
MDQPRIREFSLYDGVSNRSRGWKTKRSEQVMEPSSSNPNVMRWDGASRSSSSWDNLRRDPELWYRDGNCYIHLYGQGHSRRGPAFKVPFSALLEASFHPLIDKFMAQNIVKPDHHTQYDSPVSCHTQRQSRIELYIPAPPHSDKRQSYNYHLATRNLIAFALRRSMVGETLGLALTTLMRSMYEFRTKDVNNVQDMINYLDEEGYLYLKNQPAHALALLHLGETFQLKELYVEALAHCCGMSDWLFVSSGYHHLSPSNRKLIRRTRVEMDQRLGRCGNMLSTFLQDELPDAQLGLFPGARAHLDQFRTLLHGFYAARFGYYPPLAVDPLSMIYDAEIFRGMRDDFDALYQYLVDNSLSVSEDSSLLEQGGICTLWSVRSYDARQKFKTLLHPLPLLPDAPQETHSSRRIFWLGKAKSSQTQREKTYAALLKATNHDKPDILNNELVQAYRRFEENSTCQPLKTGKLENLGPTDARKVRWILIYAIYQVLRQATDPPPEVRDSINTPYHLSISTACLPVWDQRQSYTTLIRDQAGQITRSSSISTVSWGSGSLSPSSSCLEIKPDIDYLAMTKRDEQASRNKETSGGLFRRGSNLTRSLSRSLSARRSLRMFTKQPAETPTAPRRRTSYHEILVHGYGNGTHNIKLTPMPTTTSDPLSSTNKNPPPPLNLDISASSSDCSSSEAGTAETSDACAAESPTTTASTYSWDSHRRTDSGYACSEPSDASKPAKPAPVPLRTPLTPATAVCAITAVATHQGAPSRLPDAGGSLRRKYEPAPLAIRKETTPKADVAEPPTRECARLVMERSKPDDEWEVYGDLGGLREPQAGAGYGYGYGYGSGSGSLFRRVSRRNR